MVANGVAESKTNNFNYQHSRWLSLPPTGEEVVISGMSGRFPESNTIHEFRDHLFTKTDMVSDDGRRWKVDHSEIPRRTAKIYNIDKYDAGCFGVHCRQAHIMDPMMRIIMETAVEAIVDAGINPSELEGRKTGVFVSTSWSEMEIETLVGVTKPQQFPMTGYMRSLIARRISYYLKLKGPAYIIDTACSSSLNALEHAFKAIRYGQCDSALVGCTNLLLHPGISLQFFRLGVLSFDGVCRVFDQNANGYVRSDTIACIFLQKAKNSRRIYAQVINAKVNSDGFKEQGITFPSTEAQKQLMTEIYEESGIHPSDLSFLEAHGTGTQVGDPQEVEAIDCAFAKRRTEPLLVGSVKSSIGHTEPASGVCSIVKVLIAMETGLIAPNINLKQIKKGMEGFEQGRMKVVTELTELDGDEAIVGINNFGFGGNNCHAVLRRFNKIKMNGGLPEDDIPRLVCVSGRTEESVLQLLDHINDEALDAEFIGLFHQMYKGTIKNHLYRGFSIISKSGLVKTSLKFCTNQQVPLHIFFGDFINNFKILGTYLLKFPVFKNTLSRIDKILKNENLVTIDTILKYYTDQHYDILGSTCVQIGIADIFKVLELQPTAVYGASCRQFIKAYFCNEASLEDTVLFAIKISELKLNSSLHKNPKLNSQSEKEKGNFTSSVVNFKTEEESWNDSKSLQSLSEIATNSFILNISDSHLNNKDVLLSEDNIIMFLDVLGRLYEQGYNLQLDKIYPPIEYPVSRNTPMISPLILWDHDKSWYTYKFSQFTRSDAEQKEYNISVLHEEHTFMAGHVIDGRNLFPATEYLHLVWQTIAQSQRLLVSDIPVVFEDCRFVRAVTMPKNGFVKLLVKIQRGSGNFEVLEKDTIVVSGRVSSCADVKEKQTNLEPWSFDDKNVTQILLQDEIYRELYLRGYEYSGLFKGIVKCDVEAATGLIKWEDNWTSFMDKMLQMKILKTDTRLLYVPVGIKKLSIDPVKHLKITEQLEKEEQLFPVHVYEDCNIIKSGGIEICGLQAKSISRKRQRLSPVLEKYEFVPNCATIDLSQSIRVSTQIILENSLENNFKAVEIVDDFTKPGAESLLPWVCRALDDVPVVTPNLVISTKGTIEETPGVIVEEVTLTPQSNFLLIVGTNILQRSTLLKQVLSSVSKNGFILTREEPDFVFENFQDIEILTEFLTENEKLVLFRKHEEETNTKFIEVSSENFYWLPQLQNFLKHEPNVVVYATNQKREGLLGLVNCIRREPNGNKLRCFFMMDEAPKFNPQDPFYVNQINKKMAINVYKNNKWGTYRHLLLEETTEIECEHCYGNVTTRGDLSTLKWIEGPLNVDTPLKQDSVLILTYYSAINFIDVMAASGRVNADAFTTDRIAQECLIGFEYAGKDLSGRRVMGMTDCGSLSSFVVTDYKWDVPNSWTMEEAATVPVAYSTVIYSLLMIRELRPYSSILIHSGTGGVGLAALNVCLHHKCDIYVTVGTQEKREYLNKHYPQIPDNHIGNSRDTSFEEMIKKETEGRGVDIVLNSLADDKLKASVRCLARGGHFMEIGKFDLANDTSLELLMMQKGVSYHGIMMDKIFRESPELKQKVLKGISEGIEKGYVKPLPTMVFDCAEMQAAHRYMMTGKHIGKVMVKIRHEEEDNLPHSRKLKFKAIPRFNCDSRKCYIIIGGLGGVGLELADWLVLRGATKLILVSRSGIQSGYHTQRLKIWRSYGVEITLSTEDITTKQGCIDLIREAKKVGSIDAIFNLAVVLKDALFEDQTEESFLASLSPKAQATIHLDRVTRQLCPDLRYFVVFSSVSCGRGNAGQSNYGMSNSMMERICEQRKRDGLPALAIQWGAIGEVGLVAKMQKENKELVIGGTLQQKISSCLEVLDKFLKQEHPIVASMVVADKHNRSHGVVSAVEAVSYVLGIKDIKTVSQHATLPELGMDSMMGTEVVQLLEKDFEIYVTPKDLRSLTFTTLNELETESKKNIEEKDTDKRQQGTNLLLQFIPESETGHLPTVRLPSLVEENEKAKTVFLLPGIEGAFKPLENLALKLKAHVIGMKYEYHNPESTIQETARNIAPRIETYLSKDVPFLIIGYSFGVDVALEVVALLEHRGYTGKIVLIDGSPTYLISSANEFFPSEKSEFQTALIFHILALIIPIGALTQYKDKLLKCANLNDRIDLASTLVPLELEDGQQLKKQGAVTLYKRLKSVINYKFQHQKVKSSVHLFKAKYSMAKATDDYQLSELCEGKVQFTTVEGDHATILNQPELADEINKIIS